MRWLWLALAACTPKGEPEPAGPLGDGLANPFPQSGQVVDGRLALTDLPTADADTPLPVASLSYRAGFSPGQVAVLRLPGLDGSRLPGPDAVDRDGASVLMIDLDRGVPLPCMAELDAAAETDPALLVRPLTALPEAEIAVVVTTDVVARPAGFAVDGEVTGPLLDRLAELGIASENVAVAWSFPVRDGTAPLRSAIAQAEVLGPPSLVEDEAGRERTLTWRAFEGTFPVVDFVGEAGLLDVADDGTVRPQGEADAALFVHVPASVADADPGTVPVMVFGHGIFSSPTLYLAQTTDGDGVRALADELGAIVVATPWRGLTTSDLSVPLAAADDFGQFPRIPNLLVQAHVNVRTLIAGLREGSFARDAAFLGRDGQSLPDPERIRYYGISLGAIEGAVMLALDPGLDATAFHVGGGMWSTMLERSSNWSLLEAGLEQQIRDPGDRQVLYATTQLWWDPVDPIAYAETLATESFLYQLSIGDEQVPNVVSVALARALGLPVAEPAPFVAEGLEPVATPAAAPARALVWFDPEEPLPPQANRPAPTTGAHTAPRLWDGARRQVVDYLDPSDPERLVHYCGPDPCTASNATP
ncbi:MAG: hypothetical protein AAF211_10775 [Myxococcota bacterium]